MVPRRGKPSLLDADGAIRDLSAMIDEIADEHLTPDGLAKLRQLDVFDET